MGKQGFRPHPAAIFGYLSRVVYLLIIPFARGLFLALRAGSLLAWAHGAWFDILVLLFIVGLAVVRWRLTIYRYDEKGLYLARGLLLRRTQFLPMKHITTLSVEYPFLLRPIRAVVLRADTTGGSARSYDFEVLVRKKDAEAALGARLCQADPPRRAKRVYFPHSLHIAALSAFLSNSFAGVLFASALISRAGSVFGEKLEGKVLSLLAQISSSIELGIPPIATMLALIILGGWFIGFVRNLLRLTRFRAARSGRLLTITGGLVTRRTYSVDVGKVFYLDIRQSLMTRLLRIQLVFIRCTGYGKGKNEPSALIPAATRSELAYTLSGLLPGIRPHARTLKPRPGVWPRYLLPWLFGVPLLPGVYWAVYRLFPLWRQLSNFLFFMLWFPLGWVLALKLLDFFTAGVSNEGGILTLRYSRGLILHTVAVRPEHVAMLTVSQSLFQRKKDSCDLIVRTDRESHGFESSHKVKGLDRRQTVQLLGLRYS